MPKPVGYRLLVKLYIRPDKTKGGIVIPDITQREDKFSQPFGQVVAMGPDAYTDAKHFPSGAWCKLGDWIAFNRSEAFPIVYDGVPYANINDNMVLDVLPDIEAAVRITVAHKV